MVLGTDDFIRIIEVMMGMSINYSEYEFISEQNIMNIFINNIRL